MKNPPSLNVILLSFLAIAIQIQVLLGTSDTYMGLRVNLADFLIPIAGLFVLKTLIFKQSKWPKWQRPCNDIWFFILLGVIIMGLANTYIQHGTIGEWALLNRGAGWVVLTGYIYFMAWSVTNFGERALFIYIRSFLVFALATIVFGTIWFLVTQYDADYSNKERQYLQFSGFMGNRNAFAFLILVVGILYTVFDEKRVIFLPKLQTPIVHILWFFLPLALVFNGSRAGWIGLSLFFLWLIISKFKYSLRFVLPALALSSLVIGYMYLSNPASVFREDQAEKILGLGSGNVVYDTDNLRLTVFEDAMELWSNHKVFGAGIGTFLTYQEEKHGKILDQIDNSALWVLTELGLVGAIIFGGFYIVAFIALWNTYKKTEGIQSAFAQAMMVIMVFFALYSLVHQILYARYLWVFLGMALAVPYKKSKTQ